MEISTYIMPSEQRTLYISIISNTNTAVSQIMEVITLILLDSLTNRHETWSPETI
jgi:hypothetical protein